MVTPWLALTVPRVPGWQPMTPEDHGPSNGYIFGYDHPSGITVTIFVYNRGLGLIQRQLPALQSELGEAVSGVYQAQRAGRYQSARELDRGAGTLSPEPGSPLTAWARLMIAQDGPERMSTIYVTTHRGYFFKVRVSLRRDATPETEGLVGGLLSALSAVVRE